MSKPLLKSEWEVLREQLKSEKNVLKALEEHYTEALNDIEGKIASLLGRQDANLPHVIRRIEYQRMIKAQVKAALDALHAKEYETISDYLHESYTDAFVGSVYTLHHQDVPVILPIDQSAAVKAVTIDSKLKSDLYTALGKDINQLKKTVASEITRGIASGMPYDDIARNLKNAAGVPLRKARTITRTEAGRVQEQATYDAAREAKAVGADVVKQWSSIRDGKTRDSHRKLDGQVRELDEPFEVNGHKGMHPHDFGVAEEDINCRCTMLTRARSAIGADDLKLMQERAAYHGLLVKDSKAFGEAKKKDFADFKKQYLKSTQTLMKQGESGIIELPKDPYYEGLSRDDIAKRYKKTDGSNLLDKNFMDMSIDVQRETVRGYDKAISMYGDYPPQRLKAGKLSRNVFATYSLDFKTITFNETAISDQGQAYATTIHEMTHHAENIELFKADEVLKNALKNLGLRSNSKQAVTLKMKTIGSASLDDYNNPDEVVAYAIERQMTGRKNPLTEEIYSVLKEKGVIK